MKLNSTVVLTLILLTMMFGAGVVSAAFGFAIGREALKGITQPDIRPNSNGGRSPAPARRDEVVLLRESDILAKVKARMEGGATKSPAATEKVENNNRNSGTNENTNDNAQTKLPLTNQNRGVTLAVNSVREQSGNLVMNVSLRNEQNQAVQFLYSFLNVVDDKGRALSANTEGLPTEVPANSQTFSGTVSIPTALLENSKQLSLTLTDYPDQRLQLQISGIPVMKEAVSKPSSY